MWKPRIAFPLLGKELVEQANRKRTYVLRIILALIMASTFIAVLSEGLSSARDYTYDLWRMKMIGANIMATVLACQFIAVLVVLPASMASVLTIEKERNSLELLLLTRLRPWEIVLQKYFSRIIPVLMFIFLSMPLMAIAYAFGYAEAEINTAFVELIVMIFYIGAWGIFFSSFCRNSVTAIINTYIIIILSFLVFSMTIDMYLRFSSFYLFLTLCLIAQGVITILCLIFAIIFLKSRKMPKKGNPFLRMFNRMDRFWKRMNKVTGGIEIIQSDEYRLPEDNPITWYEKFKRPTGRKHYLGRIAIFLCIPVFFFYVSYAVIQEGEIVMLGHFIMVVLFSIAAIVAVCKGISVVSDEKQNRTLDVLLTTSVTPRKLVSERMRGHLKLCLVLGIPMFFLLLIIAYIGFADLYRRYYYRHYYSQSITAIRYVIMILCCYFIYLRCLSWFSCWLGLKLSTPRKAFAVAFVCFGLWMFLPFIPWAISEIYNWGADIEKFFEGVSYFSPIMPFAAVFDRRFSLTGFIISSLVIFLLYLWVKHWCLSRADKYLRK